MEEKMKVVVIWYNENNERKWKKKKLTDMEFEEKLPKLRKYKDTWYYWESK